MIYTYSLNNEFISEFDNEYTASESIKIDQFIRDIFFKKENIYFCGTRDFSEKYGNVKNGLTNSLIQSFNNELGPLENQSKKGIDFGLSGKKNKIGNMSITCKNIIDNKTDLIEKINNLTVEYWIGKKYQKEEIKKKEKKHLESSLKRIFKYSDKIYFIDRYIPIILAENKSYNDVISYKKSLIVFSKLLSEYNLQINFFSGLNKKQKADYSKDQFDKILRNYFEKLENLDVKIFVKDDDDAFEILHERYIASYLDNSLFNLFQASRGIAFWDKNYSIKNGKFERKPNKLAENLTDEFRKKVEKSNNFLFFELRSKKN